MDTEALPLEDGGVVEWVSEFPYLGSLVVEDGRSHQEVDKRIANTSRAYGALRRAVFKDSHLSMATKKSVYNACVPSVLLYGSECCMGATQEGYLKKIYRQLPPPMCMYCAWYHQPVQQQWE